MRATCVIVLLCALVATGCVTAGGFASDPLDRGELWHFDLPFDQVVSAARETFVRLEQSVEETRPTDTSWVMVAVEGAVPDSDGIDLGDLVRVVVEESSTSDGARG